MASFINNNTHLDSGWTGFYEGSLIHSPRRLFLLLTAIFETLFETGSSVENLALLVVRIRDDQKLVNALARFALQVQEYRQHSFRQLSSEAKQKSLSTQLDMSFSI